MLARLPGVNIGNSRTYSALGLRGFNRPGDYSWRTRLAIDGQRLNDAIFDQGLPQLELPVMAEWVKRVELVQGPGSSIYGSNALLGVVNIVTLDRADAPGLSMTGSLGEHRQRRAELHYGASSASHGDFFIGFNAQRTDGENLAGRVQSGGREFRPHRRAGAALALLRRDLDAWRTVGLSCPTVALKLSWEQCRKAQHRERFLQQLGTLRLGPQEVEFELTERADFEDIDKPDSFVFTLQGPGCGLAIDDFGTGYSSLAYLRRFRCRKLKIDRLFVHGLSANAESHMLVESMVRVAHAMRMVVVAEGVELSAGEAALVAMGS